MRLSDFDYPLPEELIAQEPPAARDGARMLVLHRGEQRWEDRWFRELPGFLREEDCLVLNDSRVLASRLIRQRGQAEAPVPHAEVMLIEPVSSGAREWRALVRPGRKLRVGVVVQFSADFSAEITAIGERGERTVRLLGGDDVYEAIDRLGHVPLPPYIKRSDRAEDRERYQTVFARERGSVAAPTAGLHFTGAILEQVRGAGAHIAHVTLHVGLGTFQPLTLTQGPDGREDFENHQLHYERYSISEESWLEIGAAQRVVAVGTTSVRTIESASATGKRNGLTNLFIYPGYRFRRVDSMLTNFHLPRTSLLLLVCALAGTELTLAAYRHAVEERYRFFSYGDCMLIL
jgi:S-adenosylmethionine:tRNA ribosyltransferase-isomerase